MDMEKKQAVLISCTDHYHNRMYVIEGYLQSLGYETRYITSDFHHNKKQAFLCDVPGAVQLPVRPYRKNLSVARILSHRDFAKGVETYLEELPREPEIVVGELPPNFLTLYLARYKRKHPNVKLVFDIFDLWPETFPFGKLKKLLTPVFSLWAALRDRNLLTADRVVTECDLFREKLGLTENEKCRTVYLAGTAAPNLELSPELPEDMLNLCYLGAVNNIIDIPAIADLVKALSASKPVCVHVIGKGERLEEFLAALAAAGALVENHGAVYDEVEKQSIMARCHFGLNVMKPSVCIGLTMKSVDYWSHGLPILNNIPADTARMVESAGLGVNLTPDAPLAVSQMSPEQMLFLRENVRRTFAEEFELGVVLRKLAAALEGIAT